MRGREIVGGYIQICDTCEKEIPGQSLYWPNRDFTLCYGCLKALAIEHVFPGLSQDENVAVKRRVVTEELRQEVFARDEFKCVECGDHEKLNLHHIVPFCVGGETSADNLQTLCVGCHKTKKRG